MQDREGGKGKISIREDEVFDDDWYLHIIPAMPGAPGS